MADKNRTTSIKTEKVFKQPGQAVSFFQTVQLLLKSAPAAVTPGNRGPLTKEHIVFRSNASLAFPVREVEEIEYDNDIHCHLPKVRVTVNFMGLYGPSSPLPDHYTEEILFSGKEDSDSRRFLDIFNHRYISFFYRCWEKYRYPLQYKEGATDNYSRWVLSLIGLGSPVLRENSSLDWARLLPLTGLLGLRIGSAAILKQVISSYFGLCAVSIEQNVTNKARIHPEQLNRLGVSNNNLGISATLGETVNECAGKFRVCIGPVSLKLYKSFLPGGPSYKALHELVALTIRTPLQFDIKLILDPSDVPVCIMSKDTISQLGISSWIGKNQGKEVSVLSD